jgi:hypothetical protein
MAPRPVRPLFRELVLRDCAALGLTPEAVAAATPLVLLPEGRQAPIERGGPDFLGWTRLYIGMRSASRQLRVGRWQIREDQMWPAGQGAEVFRLASEDLRGNPSIAVASVWVPVRRRQGAGGLVETLVLGPALNPLFARLQWVALAEAGTLQESVQEDFLPDEVHVRLPVRDALFDPEDPRMWRRFRWPAAGQGGR